MSKKTTSQPQIEDQAHYYKIGRLRKPIAEKIHRKSADIYIDDNHLKHIFLQHKNDLEKVGLTPLMFVDLVVNNFDRIYKSSTNSIFLVKWNGAPKVAVIQLNFALKKEFYEVRTAFIRAKNALKEKDLLWKKE